MSTTAARFALVTGANKGQGFETSRQLARMGITDMGGPGAPLSPEVGARTAVRLATLGVDGPTGKFFHGEDELPW